MVNIEFMRAFIQLTFRCESLLICEVLCKVEYLSNYLPRLDILHCQHWQERFFDQARICHIDSSNLFWVLLLQGFEGVCHGLGEVCVSIRTGWYSQMIEL